jgi:tetratricopeptide (TPR) repeat protein
MSKKKKISQAPSVETLQADAARWLADGHHKEAIEAYKQLLKTEPRQEWQTALTTAYLERAKALAHKNMFKEAAALWESRASLCENEGSLELYLTWLLRAGRYGKAARLYVENTERLPKTEDTHQLPALFGLLLLTGQLEIAENFPADSFLRTQYPVVQGALQAYCQRDDTAADTYLKQIPFRSPYRDFRSLLKALMILETEPQEAIKLLEKIPGNSPYHNLVKLIRLDHTRLEMLGQLSSSEQTFVACLKGWDKQQVKLIPTLQSAARHDSTRTLFDVVVTNKQVLGEGYARQFCLALLPNYPPLLKNYERIFEPLSVFAQKRIEALYFERQNNSIMADKSWREGVASLKQDRSTPENALKAAMILRHLVDLAIRRGEGEDDEVLADLEASLNLDPEAKSSYLKLIQLHQARGDKKSYHKWVDVAVKHFPTEGDVLMVAIESATEKKAFKKAVKFANTLLKVDPINVKARQILLSSHVSHARKLIKSGKYDLAWKELNQASRIEKSNQRSGVIQINQGLLKLQQGGGKEPEQQAKQLIVEGLQLAGGGLRGQFRVRVETKLLGIKKFEEQVWPLLPVLARNYLPSRQEVSELVSLINAYHEADVDFLLKVLEPFQATLQNAAQQDFSKDELMSICQCFKQLEHYELLKLYARQAMKKWPEQPIFVYYQIVGKIAGQFSSMNETEVQRLHEALDKAEQQGDKRTSMMITGFLTEIAKQGMRSMGGWGEGFFPFNIPADWLEDDDADGEFEDDEFMGGLDEQQLAELIEMFEQMTGRRGRGKGMPLPELPKPSVQGKKDKPKKQK